MVCPHPILCRNLHFLVVFSLDGVVHLACKPRALTSASVMSYVVADGGSEIGPTGELHSVLNKSESVGGLDGSCDPVVAMKSDPMLADLVKHLSGNAALVQLQVNAPSVPLG